MVSSISIVSMTITLIICFGLPIGLFIYFYKKERISIIPVVVGALVFIVSQIVIRIPLLNIFSTMEWYQKMASNIFLIAIFLSITAGIFEEVGRYIGFKFFLKKYLTWKNGVAFGIGHGGIEAIVLIGFSYINNLVYSVLINTGAFEKTVAPQLGAEMSSYIVNQLVDLPPYMFLVGGLERAFTIFIHIALSLIVLLAVKKGKKIFLLYAVMFHTLVNYPPVIITGLGYSFFFAEIYLLVLAILSWFFIFRSKEAFSSGIE